MWGGVFLFGLEERFFFPFALNASFPQRGCFTMPKRKSQEKAPPGLTVYTVTLTEEQMDKLEHLCDERCFGFREVPHARFAFEAPFDKVNLVAYKSGKLVIQGRGTEAFVRDYLEAQITGSPQLGYEEVNHPDWFEPHGGLDEAGKGDLFGPLVSCCVLADGDMVRGWLKAGVKDSKALGEGTIFKLEKVILNTPGVVVKRTQANMSRYNELMAKPRANLNRLLAWYHARGLQEALRQRQVPWALVDQFSEQPLTQRQMAKDGFKDFDLRMRTKAESDPVVAAASICARAEFVRQMQKLSEDYGEPLKLGAGAAVKAQAVALVAKLGPEALGRFAKLHFRTAKEVLGLPVEEKKPWVRRSSKSGESAPE